MKKSEIAIIIVVVIVIIIIIVIVIIIIITGAEWLPTFALLGVVIALAVRR